jgi:hypothetical protein
VRKRAPGTKNWTVEFLDAQTFRLLDFRIFRQSDNPVIQTGGFPITQASRSQHSVHLIVW